jgi:hypothetical protein
MQRVESFEQNQRVTFKVLHLGKAKYLPATMLFDGDGVQRGWNNK